MNSSNEIKVLIGDNTADIGVRIASHLKSSGLSAFTRQKNASGIYNSIIRDNPDVVVIDLELPEFDAIQLMQHVNNMMSEPPAFIIITEINNSYIERQLIESGASYCLTKPFEPETLCTIIKSVYSRPISCDCCDKEILVTNTIQRLSIPAHIKGYHYLRTAILSTLSEDLYFDSITKQLYPLVAKKHDTTPARVERAIRHAIEIAWNRGASSEISSLFGYNPDMYSCRPTNSEFIALISDKLRLKLKSQRGKIMGI